MSSKTNVDEKESVKDVPDTSATTSKTQYTRVTSHLIKSPTEKFASHYNMDKKGLAIIFNHEKFYFDNLAPRTGTDRDSANLRKTLQSLGFTIREHKDFTYEQIKLTLQAVANQNHTDHDCLIVCILTYGGLGVLYARDKHYRADTIWSYFSLIKPPTNDKEKEKEENLLTLVGKPKLFFIQACQVRKLSVQDEFRPNMETFTVPDEFSAYENIFRIPNHADVLIAYSTMSGYYSWSTSKQGSWFIETLCKVLNRFGTQYDLLTLLTSVCHCVQNEYENNATEQIKSIQKKEIPNITSMLTRLVKFKAAGDVKN